MSQMPIRHCENRITLGFWMNKGAVKRFFRPLDRFFVFSQSEHGKSLAHLEKRHAGIVFTRCQSCIRKSVNQEQIHIRVREETSFGHAVCNINILCVTEAAEHLLT